MPSDSLVIPLLGKVIPFIKNVKGYDSEQTRIDVLSHAVFPLIAWEKIP